MNINNTLLLRIPLVIILIIHGVGGMFNGGIYQFGTLFLDKIGFAPFGLALAWIVKLSHLLCAAALMWNKYFKWPLIFTIFIMIMGIFLVHLKDGWFVVGGGRNGVEFNILLIAVMSYLLVIEQK